MVPQAKQFYPRHELDVGTARNGGEYVLVANYIGRTSNIRYHPIFHNGYPIFTIVDRRLRMCDAKSDRDRKRERERGKPGTETPSY